MFSGKLKDKFDTRDMEVNAKWDVVKGRHLLLELLEFSGTDKLSHCGIKFSPLSCLSFKGLFQVFTIDTILTIEFISDWHIQSTNLAINSCEHRQCRSPFRSIFTISAQPPFSILVTSYHNRES